MSAGKRETLYFLVTGRDSYSTFVAKLADPKVFVIASVGAPSNLLFYSLTGTPDDSENLINFLRMVRIFLFLSRLGFGRVSKSGLNAW